MDLVLRSPGYISDGTQTACCHVEYGDVGIFAPSVGDGTRSPPLSRYFALILIRSRSPVRVCVCVHPDVRRDPERLLRSGSVATLTDHFGVTYQVGPSSFDGVSSHLTPHSFSKNPRTR